MIKKIKQRKGQSTLEYALLVGIIAIAVLASQNYIKRAVQGGAADAIKGVGTQFDMDDGAYTIVTTSDSRTQETLFDAQGTGGAGYSITDELDNRVTTTETIERVGTTTDPAAATLVDRQDDLQGTTPLWE